MSEVLLELHAVDLDRTLLDTDEAFNKFVDVCVDAGAVSVAAVTSAREQVEATGGSFDVVRFLKESEELRDAEIAELYERFGTTTDPDSVLFPDAKDYLDRVAGRFVVVTYGGMDWQTAKLRAAGLTDTPHLVTSQKNKGDLIAGWRTKEGVYDVPDGLGGTILTDTVKLIDDKAGAFEGLPADCGGFWLVRNAVLLPSQAGEVPASVHRIASLDEISVAS